MASAAVMAMPHAVVGVLAWVPTAVSLPVVGEEVVVALLISAAMWGGSLLGGAIGLPAWRRVWLANLCICGLLWPALGLHVTLARMPFASRAWGSAGSVVATALLAAAALIGVAAFVAFAVADEPERASLVFAPASLLVPVMLGVRQELDEGTALRALGGAFFVAGAAVFLAALMPRPAWSFVGPGALAVLFVGLWMLGYRPAWGEKTDGLVPLASAMLLVLAITLGVLEPMVAVLAGRVLAVDEESGLDTED